MCGGRSFGIVCLQAKATEFSLFGFILLMADTILSKYNPFTQYSLPCRWSQNIHLNVRCRSVFFIVKRGSDSSGDAMSLLHSCVGPPETKLVIWDP
jgi:hypothetical protein